MPFHRLSVPAYYISGGGPLLPSYDYLNNPVGGGTGTGIATPADTADKVGGTYDGVYFIAEGEAANAYNLNRPVRALGESVDLLDDALHSSIAQKTSTTFVSTGDATRDLDGSTNNIYTGAALVDPSVYFQVTNAIGHPLFVNGRYVVVTASGVAIGSGFSAANPLTLTFNQTIPTGTTYQVHYTVRSYLSALSPEALSSKAGDLRLNSTGHSYDNDVTTVTDGGTVSGLTVKEKGDFDAVIITPLLSGTTYRGLLSLRAGTYRIDGAQNWSSAARVHNAQLGATPAVKVDSGRGADVLLTTHIAFRDVSLGTNSTANYHFVAQSNFAYEGLSNNALVEAGALELAGSSTVHHQTLKNLRLQANATMLGAVLASLRLSGVSTTTIEDSDLTAYPTGATGVLAYLYIDSFTGTAIIRNTVIGGSASGVDGLRINASVGGSITFENCVITHTGTGDAWAFRAVSSNNIVFRNCQFHSERGQAIRVQGSGVTFEDCIYTSGADTGLANPQLICGEGYVDNSTAKSLKFIRCRAVYGTPNVITTGAPTKPIIELGGRDGVVEPGRVEVDGLYIEPGTGVTGSHQHTAFVFLSDVDNKTPCTYRNITIDEFGRAPTGAGTLSKYNGSFGSDAYLVEVVGAADRNKIVLENLQVINVKAPATNLSRGVVGLDRVTAKNVTLDGFSASAGSFTGSLVELLGTDLNVLHMFSVVGVECRNNYDVQVEGSSVLQGLRYHRRGLALLTGERLFLVGAHSLLKDSIIYSNVGLDVGAATSTMLATIGQLGALHNVVFVVDGTVTGGLMLGNSGADEIMTTGCRLRWSNAAADTMVDFTGADHSVLTGNTFGSTAAFTPVVTYTGTGRIPDGSVVGVTDLNVVAQLVETTDPVVFA